MNTTIEIAGKTNGIYKAIVLKVLISCAVISAAVAVPVIPAAIAT